MKLFSVVLLAVLAAAAAVSAATVDGNMVFVYRDDHKKTVQARRGQVVRVRVDPTLAADRRTCFLAYSPPVASNPKVLRTTSSSGPGFGAVSLATFDVIADKGRSFITAKGTLVARMEANGCNGLKPPLAFNVTISVV
ncbi:hypothetical protein GQ42DRAFT_52237 [Ramicandelaber brevisporus]|nr:hypothetical protein GQ42DRAFT_52237 [Ramicandelaber brevisporus]